MGTKWEQLRALVSGDGCTSSPELWFHEACETHDDDYRFHMDEEGKELTRLEADNRFLKNMRAAAPNWWIRNTIPFLYYTAVRVAGGAFWDRIDNGNA